MHKFKKTAVIVLLVASLTTTGCDVSKILDVVTKVAGAVTEAIPKVKEVIDTVTKALPKNTDTAATNTTPAPANEANATEKANVTITNPGDNEEIANKAKTNLPADKPDAGPANTAVTAERERVTSSIRSLIGSTEFRGEEVDGGNLACAQVVSTALKNAGVLSRVTLNCDLVVADLNEVGWKAVDAPPYQDGDIVTWTNSLGENGHIGVIVKEGSTFQAISNSSSEKMPRMHSINYMPITQILRKA